MPQPFSRIHAFVFAGAIAGFMSTSPSFAEATKKDGNVTRVAKAVAGPAKAQRQARAASAALAPGMAAHDDARTLVSLYARRHGVPETLAHRIVARESRYNPGLIGRGHFGLMQISLPTARQMGYAGPPQGLLDARTNLSHGMPYLANAWIVSGGNEARATSLYMRGYYYEAKRKGLVKSLRTARSAPVEASTDVAEAK